MTADTDADTDAGADGETPWAGRGLERLLRVTTDRESTLRDAVASQVPAGCRVLDVGCGNGRLRAHLYGNYTGLDWEADLNPDEVGDTQEMPFDDDEFDVAVAKNHLQHVEDWRATVAEMQRVASRGVVIAEPAWLPETRVIADDPVRRRVFAVQDVVDELGGAEFRRLAVDDRMWLFWTVLTQEIWREATAETKRRFDEEDVTEEDVEDAIQWARSSGG